MMISPEISTFWSDLVVPGVPLLEKVVRTVVVYGALLFGLRLAGKRELSQLNAFDLVVLLLLSNTVQNAIIGNDNSVVGGLFGAAVLLLLNHFLVRYLFKSGRLDKLEGSPDILILDGIVAHDRLSNELITLAELEAAARRQGIASLEQVQECRLETGGALTFVARTPTPEAAQHKELIDRLTRIEESIARLQQARSPAS
ncbi:MAG TPA: YetF domain-containing protein [Gemmatimonadaceae bacterium]|nr:YetF domain-containing protein [Gemmatimonadaceae bacterium]